MKFDVSNRNLQNIMPDILKKNLQFLSSSFDELIDEANVESALFDSNCLSKLGSIDIFLNLKHVCILVSFKIPLLDHKTTIVIYNFFNSQVITY